VAVNGPIPGTAASVWQTGCARDTRSTRCVTRSMRASSSVSWDSILKWFVFDAYRNDSLAYRCRSENDRV
jgi:hypothetical protein